MRQNWDFTAVYTRSNIPLATYYFGQEYLAVCPRVKYLFLILYTCSSVSMYCICPMQYFIYMFVCVYVLYLSNAVLYIHVRLCPCIVSVQCSTLYTCSSVSLYCICPMQQVLCLFWGQHSQVSQGLLIHEVSRLHTTTQHCR
jgi:hypothetical protein